MINQLVKNIKKLDAPIVVGLDPMLSYVPEHIQKAAFDEYGETLEGAAEAIWQYNKGIIDSTYDLIPAVKPQIAMYEQFGVPGLAAFQKTCEYAKSKGLVIIGDIKRGDIGFCDSQSISGQRRSSSVYGSMQRRKERNLCSCEDIQSFQRGIPGSGNQRKTAV